MTKSYPELLGEWIKRRESTKRDRYLAAFLAVRDDVKAAVNAGYPIMTIWANMVEAGQVACGYETFRNYVNRYVRRADESHTSTSPAPTSDRAQAPRVPTVRKIAGTSPGDQASKPATIPGFTFNSEPRKEDLI